MRVWKSIGLIVAVLPLALAGCDESMRTASPGSPAPEYAGGPVAQAHQIVLAALADTDPRLRANAIEVVATTGRVELMGQVAKLLNDPSFPVRFGAAVAVGDLAYTPALQQVGALLNDTDTNVRLAAAYALMRLNQGNGYFETLCQAVTSNDQTVRANAALLLGKSGRQEALKFLYWTLQQSDSTDKVLFQAAQSIAMLGDERIMPKLWTLLISAYADDRIIGIEGMGALRTEQAKNALITMLDDPVLEVRLAAATELGKLGDTIGESEVLDALRQDAIDASDPRAPERIKVLAALAIGAIGTDDLIVYLPEFLADPSARVRLAAAKATLQLAGR